MIASQFLHSFIVVRPLDPNDPDTAYRVSAAARADVPTFGPELEEGILQPREVRDFLLTKLINAEHAAYRAHKIAELHVSAASTQHECTPVWHRAWWRHLVWFQERTRSALLDALFKKLEEMNSSYLNHPPSPQSAKTEGSGLFDTFKRAISGKVRSQSVDSHLSTRRPPSLVAMATALPPVGEHSSKPNATPILRLVTMTLCRWLPWKRFFGVAHFFLSMVSNIIFYRLSKIFYFFNFRPKLLRNFSSFFHRFCRKFLGPILSIPRLLHAVVLVVGVRFRYPCQDVREVDFIFFVVFLQGNRKMKAMRRNCSEGSNNLNKMSSLTSNRDSVDSAHSLPPTTPSMRENCSSPSLRHSGDCGGSPYSDQSSPETRAAKSKRCKR